ncbi:uncharacterized protein LOC108627998 [Ceratina calcarata]|uniref:Uncharacterized protein LOC108627998 n=1 Tax=Ceratina calcarata TaxID=156304 RepID=A0AAJ7J6D7_9HYME|nr:uncharacterized protein LOC108627998 [Ceratina calcarata]XP_026671934.1 uncharacterized protein LOC108627998 [Ceratina calcarata]
MPQGSIHWQGTQRRACAPGAHWNVQVVRGKMTTQCLWYACKALGIGLLLMLLGACMATIGYFADQLSVAQEVRGNLTIDVKNESRGFHLNNLSYAGPIVMGVGGFIVVAACVMTFEARDNAAKVVPARFRFTQASTIKNTRNQRNRRSTSSQTTKWDHQLGVFRMNKSPSPSVHEVSRKQLTTKFMQFSKELNEKQAGHSIKKSPSAPTLIDKKSPRKRTSKYAGCALLNPDLLQRHALSVDNPSYSPQVSRESLDQQKMGGSQGSMAMDLHIPDKGPVTLKVKDRSDTARRHQLLRQTKVEYVEEVDEAAKSLMTRGYSPKLTGAYSKYPDDFVPRKRNSIDIRLLEELAATKDLTKISPRDFRKISSQSFHRMSFDKTGSERKVDKSMGHRKASLEFKKSPDFRRIDYRKLSAERFSIDCTKYLSDEVGIRSRASSGENLRRQRQPKLHHSRSDDNKRASFEKQQKDAQLSRYSLNTQAVIESGGCEAEFKYFTVTSLDTEESRADNSDESHGIDVDEPIAANVSSEGPTEADALLEEPELENVPEVEIENLRDDLQETEAMIKTEKSQKEQGENANDFCSEDLQDFVRCEETTVYIEDDEV